ncbi:NAD(P)/FAD-dependent oxidoreductase [uncultured Maricaulis sp.]|uniref:flavin-containing monooxygenase n=1 Tax=uncultured Maricaulis sp. TaxID=174710 RepID=UPI002611CDFE|nr:NAD(P)/FAD-dependent oxidoreductase [uncultured Maricaulis sp.]
MSDHDLDVLIVGAGLSGIGAAYHLQTRCPGRSYAILEARDAIGGTWDLFRYPGIRSDSDMYTFGYAFRPWTGGKAFADGPSIRQYVRDTASENGIDRHIHFGHTVVSANWDSATARWQVTAKDANGAEQVFTARFVMLCSGYYRYSQGYLPEFAGYEDFKGAIAHPQHWDSELDYAGKKVVIIGSGATAVTLVPAMAETAGHVTMLQRSPTYIAARPSRDAIAETLRKALPAKLAYLLARIKNIGLAIYVYQLSQRWPGFVKKAVIKAVKDELGEGFDVEKHFTPSYNPWDQRFCLAPDGDFFQALKSGKADIVTDQIERFTETGIQLASGEHIEADIIVPATGLEMQLAGAAQISLDGEGVDPADLYTYRGMMLGEVPNLALAFGYTNASWTLKVDLTCERVCRMLNHMKKTGTDIAVPQVPDDITPEPLLNFSSGYVQRAIAHLPKQGDRAPWKTYQNYVQDMLTIRFGKLEDGYMNFSRAPDPVSDEAMKAAAE